MRRVEVAVERCWTWVCFIFDMGREVVFDEVKEVGIVVFVAVMSVKMAEVRLNALGNLDLQVVDPFERRQTPSRLLVMAYS